MKPNRRSRENAALTRKRALVRTLIERGGWGMPAAVGPLPDLSPENTPGATPRLAEIIPFPRSEIVRR